MDYKYPSFQSTSATLEMTNHFQVCEIIKNLDRNESINLGAALGLFYIKLKRTDTIPEDMVAAWLRGDDNVIETSGSPSWESLATALDKTGHTKIAITIRRGKCVD